MWSRSVKQATNVTFCICTASRSIRELVWLSRVLIVTAVFTICAPGMARTFDPVLDKFSVQIDVETSVDGIEVQFSRIYTCAHLFVRRFSDGRVATTWETDVRNIYEQLSGGHVVFLQVPQKCEELASAGKIVTDQYLPLMGLVDQLDEPSRIELYGSLKGFENEKHSRISPPLLRLTRLKGDVAADVGRRLDWIMDHDRCRTFRDPKRVYAAYVALSIPREIWREWSEEFVEHFSGQKESQRIEDDVHRTQFELGIGDAFKRKNFQPFYKMGGSKNGLRTDSDEDSIFNYYVPLRMNEGQLHPYFNNKGILYYELKFNDVASYSENFYNKTINFNSFLLENVKPHYWRIYYAPDQTINSSGFFLQCY